MKAFSFLSIALGATIIFASCSSAVEQSSNTSTNNVTAKVAMHDSMDDMKVMDTMEKDEMKMMDKEEVMEKQDDMMEKKEMVDVQEAVAGMYAAFSQDKYDMAQDKVLFFHASWCPACRGAHDEITSRSADLPDGALVLKTDYDLSQDLRVKYGVTGQHTFVFLDENNEAKKVKRGLDFDTLVAEL